ncbi:MAG: hypothetical protein FJ316_05075 [SAR202 cluster bacterium]|nr:hypothetical protein [SAR202 cluster bacterium]
MPERGRWGIPDEVKWLAILMALAIGPVFVAGVVAVADNTVLSSSSPYYRYEIRSGGSSSGQPIIAPSPAPSGSLQSDGRLRYSFVIYCTNQGQPCLPGYSVSVATKGHIKVEYSVPRTHCSSLRVRVQLDGREALTSGYLGWTSAPAPYNALPLSTGVLDLGQATKDVHTVTFLGEGQPSGCWGGGAGGYSWGGVVDVVP